MYDKEHYRQLQAHIYAPAAKASLKKAGLGIHDGSSIPNRYPAYVAERAIITMQEIISSSKSFKYVSQKFVNTNILD